MVVQYEKIVPWGRTFDEYARMFSLGSDCLSGRILGCGDGPASFNAEAKARGVRVVSCDPIYTFTAGQIEQRIHETSDIVLKQVEANLQDFSWKSIRSPRDMLELRLGAMRTFLASYEQGRRAQRYIAASVPHLPFRAGTFDLAVCSHLLFLYSDHLDTQFHIEAIREMLRVCREVRVFPTLDLAARESVHLRPVMAQLCRLGFRAECVQVDYEFLRGANQMLQVTR